MRLLLFYTCVKYCVRDGHSNKRAAEMIESASLFKANSKTVNQDSADRLLTGFLRYLNCLFPPAYMTYDLDYSPVITRGIMGPVFLPPANVPGTQNLPHRKSPDCGLCCTIALFKSVTFSKG